MPYHFHSDQLRVFRKFARQERNREPLRNCRFLINQHIVPNTAELLIHLKDTGAEIFCVLAKPYSIDENVAKNLASLGISILREQYSTLEKTTYLDELFVAAAEKSKADNRRIVLWDVGGYFSVPLTRLPADLVPLFAGVVEDTTFGHNKYLADAAKIPIPIFSVARSQLKEVEARFVGRDAVAAVDVALRELGIVASARNALVIGYGMIGKNVARSLEAADYNVYVYDKHDHRNLRAFVNGFHIHKKRELLKLADIIFSSTAEQAMSFEEIEECKNNVVLVSVGSKDIEFDIKSVQEQSLATRQLGSHITLYTLPNSKNVYVVRRGTAANFILPGQPAEIMDLVFAEIFISTMLLLKKPTDYRIGEVNFLPNRFINQIAKEWLRFVN